MKKLTCVLLGKVCEYGLHQSRQTQSLVNKERPKGQLRHVVEEELRWQEETLAAEQYGHPAAVRAHPTCCRLAMSLLYTSDTASYHTVVVCRPAPKRACNESRELFSKRWTRRRMRRCARGDPAVYANEDVALSRRALLTSTMFPAIVWFDCAAGVVCMAVALLQFLRWRRRRSVVSGWASITSLALSLCAWFSAGAILAGPLATSGVLYVLVMAAALLAVCSAYMGLLRLAQERQQNARPEG
jgi:hypothetical protein